MGGGTAHEGVEVARLCFQYLLCVIGISDFTMVIRGFQNDSRQVLDP